MSGSRANVAETTLPNEDPSSTDGPRGSSRPDIIRRMPSRLARRRAEGSEHSRASNARPEAARSSVAPEAVVLTLPPYERLPEYGAGSFNALQEWEGVVLEVGAESFTARLTDLTAGNKIETEEADFPIDDLRDEDRERLRSGAVFRWAIGYHRSPGGTRTRASRIVFRRLPAWTEQELRAARREAERLSAAIEWD
jgi:hypothetical protein